MSDIEQIEKYLAGELDSAEIKAFDLRVQSDTVFAETYKLYQVIQNEMNVEPGENELRENLSALSKKHFEVKDTAKVITLKTSNKKWWLYAAAAAVAITIILLLNPGNDRRLTTAEIFTQNAIPEELPAIVRGNNNDSLLRKASELFNKKAYAAALPLLDSITKVQPGEAQLQLSLGICFLQTGKYEAAIAKFETLAAGQSSYKYDALFWKALVLLKQDKKEMCITTLKQIPAEAANFDKAKKMIKMIAD